MQRNGEHSSTRICDDGVDQDLDGAADYPADPGCDDVLDPSESSPVLVCDDAIDDDGIDDDRDGFVDFADPTCDPGWPYWEAVPRCGFGAELVLALAPLAWLRRRRMRARLR